MKKAITAVVCILCAAVLTSCGVQSSAPAGTSQPTEGLYAGTYKYDYEDDTESSPEDQYIVLEDRDGSYAGRYYGTSDDFDEAREGYLPGYFVVYMRELTIGEGTISFDIDLTEKDVFSKPIDLAYLGSDDIPLLNNPLWGQSLRKNNRHYTGTIENGEIRLEMDTGERVFKKID